MIMLFLCYDSRKMKTRIALQILLGLLIGLDVITLIPWSILVFSLVGLIPVGLTIWLLVLHIRSLVSIHKQHFINLGLIKQQIIAGGLLILVVGFTIVTFSSLGTLSGNPDPAWKGISLFVISALVCAIPLGLVLWLNQRLQRALPVANPGVASDTNTTAAMPSPPTQPQPASTPGIDQNP